MKELLFDFITSPFLYLAISIIICLVCWKEKEFIDITGVIKKYIITIFNQGNKKLMAFLLMLPLLLAQTVNYSCVINYDILNIITVIISILTSMLFTFLALLNQHKIKEDVDASKKVLLKEITNETKIIINYEIFLCVFILICCFLAPITFALRPWLYFGKVGCISAKTITSNFIYFLLFHMVLNLLIIVKRYFKIFDN